MKEFREKYGHVNVPTNHRLSWWCYRIRTTHKLWVKGDINAKGLTDERVRRLEELGFEWNLKRSKKEYMERKFQELLEFKETHGHLNVPNSSPKNTKSLYWWCYHVRLEYRESIANNVPLPGPFGLTAELVHRLRQIGFRFDISVNKSFEEWFDDLREYKSVYGHIECTRGGTKIRKYQLLASWCSNIRRAHDLWMKNLPGPKGGLNEERVKKLEEMGFDFHLHRRGPRKKSNLEDNYIEF